MKRMIVSAAAILLLTAPGAFAQAAMSPAPGGTTMKSTAADAADMKANASADAAAKPKAHHRMAKNEAALNASEAQTTKQLNQEQSQLASNSGGGMASGNPAP